MLLVGVPVAEVLAAIVLSYALGCVPGSVIVARRQGVDLRRTGDGNPGAWNALRQLGWRRAWLAFALDGLKGAVAAALGWLAIGAAPGGAALGEAWVPWACVGAAMLGHALPIPHPSRGGKAVMAFAGGASVLVPPAAALLWIAVAAAAVMRRAALGARVAVFAFPIVQAAFTPLVEVGWTGLLMTIIGALFLIRRGPRAA